MAEKHIENDETNEYRLESKNESLSQKLENLKMITKTCKICLEELNESMYKLDQCDHIFCKECLIKYIDKTDDTLQIKCPSCDVLIAENVIKELLGDENLVENFESKRNAQLELSKNKISSQESEDLDGIDELIKSGLMIKCPRCSALLEKIDSGCQFIRCFMCKLDICYITRQPRWGPNGKGDTSGGCKCGVNGKKCHPDCTNCH